jgi:Zn-dependent peptidase ImmA (M78 family)
MTPSFDKNSLRYTLSEIRQKADMFRAEHWPSDVIPVDIEMILERAGFDLEPVPGMKQGCDTVACISPDLKTISIDQETMLDERQAFFLRSSLAHELGHAILHRKFFEWQKEKRMQTIPQWISFVRECHENLFPYWFEDDAWEFAGCLLVPRSHLERSLRKVLTRVPEGYLKELPSDIVRQYIASAVHREFEVNAQAVEIRLRKEDLFPQPLNSADR